MPEVSSQKVTKTSTDQNVKHVKKYDLKYYKQL